MDDDEDDDGDDPLESGSEDGLLDLDAGESGSGEAQSGSEEDEEDD